MDAPAAVRLLGDRRPRVRGQAERFDRVVGAQMQVEAEGAGDRLVGGPEGEFLLVDAALFERIEVAADAALQLRRLDVDEADFYVAVGADRPDGDVEGAVAVLLGKAGLAARLLLRLVGRAGLLLLQHLGGDRLAVDPVGEFRDGRLARHGEGIDRLEIGGLRVGEDLLDRGDRVAVLHHDLDVVVAQIERVAAAGRREQPGGVRLTAPADQHCSCDECACRGGSAKPFQNHVILHQSP